MKKKWMQLFVCISMVLAMCQGLFGLHVMAKNDTLYVAMKKDMPFYQFIDENGQAVGMHVDIMNAIAKELNRDIVYLPTETNLEALELLESGEAELVLGIPYYMEGDFHTVSEISSSETVILAPKELMEKQNLLDISKCRIALEYGMTSQIVVTKLGARQYLSAGSQERLLEAHLNGKAELMMCDRACMEYLLRERGLWEKFTIVKGQIDEPGYTIALGKNNSKLRREVENALMSIRISGDYEDISEKWIPTSEDGTVLLKKVIVVILMILIVTGSALSAYVYVLYRIRKLLQKEVDEKTNELDRKVRQLSYESELRNRIIEHSPNGMILVDWYGKITLINKNACKMAGVPKTVIGTYIFAVDFFDKLLNQVEIHDRLSLFQGVNGQNLTISDKTNEERIYQLTILPTYNEEQCNGAMVALEDITAKEEQRIAAAEKEKNQVMNRLIAGMAHEIKNPLTGIRNFAELIRTKRNDPRFLDYFAQLVPEEVDRISRLVESLMQYARPPKGKREKVDLSEILCECITLIHPMVLVKDGIAVENDTEKELFICADRDQIKQVFINFFMNGINAVERKLQMGENIASPAMLVTAVSRGDFVIVTILDHGIGMTQEEVKNCTEPFFTTRSQGNGLGLAMSKRFIQENEGTMVIESKKGIQTCITIRFRRYEL